MMNHPNPGLLSKLVIGVAVLTAVYSFVAGFAIALFAVSEEMVPAALVTNTHGITGIALALFLATWFVLSELWDAVTIIRQNVEDYHLADGSES